jgi:hypothetical protein
MPERIYVVKKENGYIVVGEFADANTPDKEFLVEGKEAKRIGLAVLAMFAKPRGPRKKAVPKAAA